MKKKCFDKKNYKALENKVNHCGRLPGVDKWRDGNVSTTSAICSLCCEFFILLPHISFSLFLISLLSGLSLLTQFFILHCVFLLYCLSFFLFFCLWVFLPSSPTQLLSKILFVRCQRSWKAGCELRESVITNNTKQKRLI